MGNNKIEFLEFCWKNKIQEPETYIKEFNEIQEKIYNKIYKITPNNVQLTPNEIEKFCAEYSFQNYSWIRDKGIKALNKWLVWICWHEGILKK